MTLLPLLAAASCTQAPTVLIRNQSNQAISNLVASGSGFTHHIGTVEAGGEVRVRVRPQGDSGLQLVFDSGGRHVDSGVQGYFESRGGYRVTATVGTNFTVTVAERIGLP